MKSQKKPEQQAQIAAIKARLNKAIDAAGFKMNPLTEAINNSDFTFDVNYNTVKKLLNTNTDAIDICTLIAICRFLNLDTSYILSPPETPDPEVNIPSNTSKFKHLDDPLYLGHFYGYFYSPNPTSNRLLSFELEMKNEKKKASAVLEYVYRSMTGTDSLPDSTVLRGVPIHDTVHDNVFIQLTNDQGNVCYFYFARQVLLRRELYFRRGVMITSSIQGPQPPLVENFVMFSRKVPKSKEIYIPGLLADISSTFYVSESALNKLRNEKSVVAKFYQEFEYLLTHDRNDAYYPIDEQNILSCVSPKMNRFDIIKALLLLKGESTSAKRYVYDEGDIYGSFADRYLTISDND